MKRICLISIFVFLTLSSCYKMDIEDIRDNPVEDVVSQFTGLPQIHIMTSLPDSAITKDSYIEAFITIKNSQKRFPMGH